MEVQRVVQILTVGAKRTISSGYQISPTLVLGCRHGVERAGVGGTVFVRGLDDLRRPAEDPSFKATVQWMGESVDAALIELPATHPAVKRCPKGDVRFARLKQDGRRRLCRGMGFPNATATAVRTNDAYIFTGGRIQRLEETNALLAELEAMPPDSTAWAGLSGAAVFYGRVLVGIMRKTHLTIGSNGLEAEPIDKAFEDAEFRRQVSGAETIPHIAPFEVSSIRRLTCRIDRNQPALCIKDHLEAITAITVKENRWPAIVVVPGSTKQRHRRFMERIAELELKAVTKIDADPQKILPELKWPKDLHIASKEAYETWLKESWRKLFSEVNPLPPNLDDLEDCAEKMQDAIDDSALCGFWVDVNFSTVESGTGQGAFLKKWSGLWQAVKNKGTKRPFVIFLCLVVDDPPAKDNRTRRFPWDKLPATEDGPTWEKAFAEQFTARLIFGDDKLQLSNLELSDIRAWAENLSAVIAQQQKLPAVYSHEIDELLESLERRLSGPFTMDEFDNKVEDFLREVRELA